VIPTNSEAPADSIELDLLRDFYAHWMQLHKHANDHPSAAAKHAQALIDLSVDIEKHLAPTVGTMQ
jgi:hypothetical protein